MLHYYYDLVIFAIGQCHGELLRAGFFLTSLYFISAVPSIPHFYLDFGSLQ